VADKLVNLATKVRPIRTVVGKKQVAALASSVAEDFYQLCLHHQNPTDISSGTMLICEYF